MNRRINDELQPIMEGGAAVGADKIPKADIQSTLLHFEKTVLGPILGLSLGKCRLIGSTGKKAESGDIDLAIPSSVFEISRDVYFHHYPIYIAETYEKLVKISPASKLNFAYKQIHAATPQIDSAGHRTGRIAQVDMIFGNPEFLAWGMSSFPEKSKYPSWVRNTLLAALGRTRIYESFEQDDISTVYTLRLSYNPNTGLLSKLEYRFKNDPSTEEPHLVNMDFVTDIPDDVARLLFDDENVNSDMLNTAEETLEQLRNGIRAGTVDGEKLKMAFVDLLREKGKVLESQVSAILAALNG